jgi:hypothetical protein
MRPADSPQAAEWRAWLAVVFGRVYRSPAELRRIASRMLDRENRETALRYLRARAARSEVAR